MKEWMKEERWKAKGSLFVYASFPLSDALRKSIGSSNIVETPYDVFRVGFLPECCSLIGQFPLSAVFLNVRVKCHG